MRRLEGGRVGVCCPTDCDTPSFPNQPSQPHQRHKHHTLKNTHTTTKVKHAKLAEATEEAVADPSKVNVKLKPENVDIAYPPIFQSGACCVCVRRVVHACVPLVVLTRLSSLSLVPPLGFGGF